MGVSLHAEAGSWKRPSPTLQKISKNLSRTRTFLSPAKLQSAPIFHSPDCLVRARFCTFREIFEVLDPMLNVFWYQRDFISRFFLEVDTIFFWIPRYCVTLFFEISPAFSGRPKWNLFRVFQGRRKFPSFHFHRWESSRIFSVFGEIFGCLVRAFWVQLKLFLTLFVVRAPLPRFSVFFCFFWNLVNFFGVCWHFLCKENYSVWARKFLNRIRGPAIVLLSLESFLEL